MRIAGFENAEKVKIFADMDGTISEWNADAHIDEVSKPGYMRERVPVTTMVEATNILYLAGYEIWIVSAVLPYDHSIPDKDFWVDTFCPWITKDHRIYVPYGTDKSEALSGLVHPGDVFLDDYTKNLEDLGEVFRPDGLVCIKVLNGINDTNHSWKGNRISIFSDSAAIAETIAALSEYEASKGIDKTAADDEEEDASKKEIPPVCGDKTMAAKEEEKPKAVLKKAIDPDYAEPHILEAIRDLGFDLPVSLPAKAPEIVKKNVLDVINVAVVSPEKSLTVPVNYLLDKETIEDMAKHVCEWAWQAGVPVGPFMYVAAYEDGTIAMFPRLLLPAGKKAIEIRRHEFADVIFEEKRAAKIFETMAPDWALLPV